MLKSRRLIALVTAAVFAIAFCFSVLFIAEEAEHNCAGGDCQICEQINVCLHFFDNFTPKPNSAFLALVISFSVVLCLGFAVEGKKLNTLVNLKVKLSN